MSKTIDLRPKYFDLLVSDVEGNRERFDDETGRFLTNGGWAVTNQDIIYPLSLLYLNEGSSYYRDESIFDIICRAGDALRDFQNPDGTVEFVKPDGSTWGAIYMPWTMLHWLETYRLMSDQLDDDRRERWAEGLQLAYTGITGKLVEQSVHNIPTWNGAASYRAGMVFNEPAWRSAGERMIARAVEGQHPAGFWPEHDGPTSSYNYVYIHALGLYHVFSGDSSVLGALERATDFQIRYSYPDGSIIETIDGRVKYHKRVNLTGQIGFQYTDRGRRFAEFLLDSAIKLNHEHTHADRAEAVKSGTIKATATLFGLNPRVAAGYEYWKPGTGEAIPQDSQGYRFHDPGFSVVTRKGSWLTCLSECTTKPVESRWGQDRQNMLSVWNAQNGLVIGGGNSKDQPEWSSFLVSKDDIVAYIPDDAEATAGEADSCTYTVGGEKIAVTSSVDNADVVHISCDGPAVATAQLLLRFHEGMKVETEAGTHELSLDEAHAWDSESCGSWICFDGVRIEISSTYQIRWPVSPFNPYAKDGSSPSADSIAICSMPLGEKSTEITISAKHG